MSSRQQSTVSQPDLTMDGLVQPFEGIRVIEIGGSIAAAGASKILSDFGADVIKIEPPDGGEARRLPPFPGDVPHLDRGGYHLALDTGKRSIVLEIDMPSGVQLLLDLARGSDVVIIHLPPEQARMVLAVLDRFGDDAPSTVTMTPHGLEGPYADHEEDDISIFARTNRMLRHSYTGEEPLRYAPYVPTLQWASTATSATMAAIWGRRHDGIRRSIEVVATEALSGNVDSWYIPWAFTGSNQVRSLGNQVAYSEGYFPCSDGYLFLSVTVPQFLKRLCEAIGFPELAEDPRIHDPLQQEEHYGEFRDAVNTYLSVRTRYEAFHELQSKGVLCAPLIDVSEAMTDPQAVARQTYVEVEQNAGVGVTTIAGPPFRIRGQSENPWQIKPAPLFGEHTAELLTEIGYSSEEQLALFRAGVTS